MVFYERELQNDSMKAKIIEFDFDFAEIEARKLMKINSKLLKLTILNGN